MYQPGMFAPHLLELAERMASAMGAQPFDQAVWVRVPKGFEDAPADHTGRRSLDDLVAGTAGAIHDGQFVQIFYLLQRTSLVFATYLCESAARPGELQQATQILRTIEIKQLAPAGST
jgi:hypothetical protein